MSSSSMPWSPEGPLPIVVVGGGIAGLSAAFELRNAAHPVVLYEPQDRVGGKVRSSAVAGKNVDEGADAFLARVPHGIELARELGLHDELISPAARHALLWTGSLTPLPQPNVLGIPLEPAAVAELLGPEAAADIEIDLARTTADPVRPDDSIGSLVRRRVGDRIHEMLVDPLMGAINAGDTDEISLAAAAPQILAAASAGPSLIAELRKQAAGRDRSAPIFHSFEGGMGVLIDALARELEPWITTGVGVEAVEPDNGSLWLTLSNGVAHSAASVVLATPTNVAAQLTDHWPAASERLASIPLVAMAFVTLAYPAGVLPIPEGCSGFVVPRDAAELTITACSYTSRKWPHLGGDVDILRVSVGHGRDQQTPALADDELIALVQGDVRTALGVDAAPITTRVSRWPHAFPQYRVGHLGRVAEIEAELQPAGLFLAGMGYRGIGIPACIDQGRRAARAALAHVEAR